MGLFNDNFKHGSIFTVNSDEFPFVNLKDIIAENGHKVLHVQGCFTYEHTKGKITKKRAVLIADNHKINLPDHCISDIEKILANKEYIDAINDGKCGFETSEYEDTNYGNGICYTGTFVDWEE